MRSTKLTMMNYVSKLEKLILADCDGKKYEKTRQWYADELIPCLDRLRSEAGSVARNYVSESADGKQNRKRKVSTLKSKDMDSTFHKYYESDAINFQFGLEGCLNKSEDVLQVTFSECSYDWFTFRYVEYPSPVKQDGSKYFKLWQAPGWLASLCLCCSRAKRTSTLSELSDEVHKWIESSRASCENGKLTTYATPSLLTKKVMNSEDFVEEDVKLAKGLWLWMCETFGQSGGVRLYVDQMDQRLQSLNLFSDDTSSRATSQEE